MTSSVRVEQITGEALKLVETYTSEDLWKLLAYEWKKSEHQVSPMRGSKDDLDKFLQGLSNEIRSRVQVNQAVVPTIVSTVVSEVIEVMSQQHPALVQFNLLIALLAAVIVEAIQAQLLKAPPQSNTATTKSDDNPT